ncbi:MAG TPA: sulfatase-like hydrolase/transferase [bacterium]
MNHVRRWLPLALGWPNALAAALWLQHLAAAARAGLWSPGKPADAAGALLGLLALQALVQAVRAPLPGAPRLRAGLTLLLLFLANALWSYQREARTPFSFDLLMQNLAEMRYYESWQVIFSRIGSVGLFVGIGGCVVLLALERRWRLLSGEAERRPVALKAVAAAGLFGALAISPLPTQDGFTSLVRSIGAYYVPDYPQTPDPAPGTFPLVRSEPGAAARTPVAPAPDVMLVMVESFAGTMVGGTTADGRAITPVFDAFAHEALSVERFYANSIQTSKGQFATLFSAIPSLRGKEFEPFADRSFLSLAALLRGFGYRTVFLQAYKDAAYDNTRAFLGANGFDVVQSVSEFMAPGDREKIWGWGLEDDVFYTRCLERLDAIRREAGDRPLFVVLAPIGNHMPFDAVPQALRGLHPAPETPRERLENSINLADRFLGTLLQEAGRRPRLAAGILAITADHATPTGEHGYFHNEAHADEEFFRIPFALRWPGRVAPRRIADAPFSQMDVAPTLLDLLQLPVARDPFQGVSLLEPARRLHPIYLVQPYSGRFLSVVEYPWKIVRHFDRDALFDLARDPGERTDVAGRPEAAAALERMRERLGQMYVNQKLLEADLIWPRGASATAP